MNLYHGTSSRNLASILRSGIRPRGRRSGNWEQYPSRKDLVYLTTAYAPYFAWHSADGEEQAVIIEVCRDGLSDLNLYPDEDFVAQALANQLKVSIDAVHRGVRDCIEGYQHHANDSIECLGNVSHKGTVPASCITRYVTVDLNQQRDLHQICLDPSISIMNYRFCGAKYRSVIAWLFGDRPDFDVGYGVPNEDYIMMMEQKFPGYADQVRGLFENRSGIEVVECKT